MKTVDVYAFEELQKHLNTERAVFEKQAEARKIKRTLLSSEEQDQLDQDFCLLFDQITKQQSKDVHLLRNLLDRGATTSKFDDYELTSATNFAIELRNWLESDPDFNIKQHVAEAFFICIAAGEAFITNRYYVGNGGSNATWLLLEYFSGSLSGTSNQSTDDFAESLFVRMILVAGSHSQFKKEFYRAFNLLFLKGYRVLTEQQKRITAIYACILVYEDGKFLETFLPEQYVSGTHLILLIKGILSSTVLPELLITKAEKSIGIFKDRQLANTVNQMISNRDLKELAGLFLKSQESRANFMRLLDKSWWLRKVLFIYSESIFLLVKEPKILKVLIKKERNSLLHLRNSQGDDLLICLCKANGPIEKTAEVLLNAGFDPNSPNSSGDTAMSIAAARKKKKLVGVLKRFEKDKS
ncbi:MAG: hypothetical protein AAFQ94_16590 [Bacteroidota bacterium]